MQSLEKMWSRLTTMFGGNTVVSTTPLQIYTWRGNDRSPDGAGGLLFLSHDEGFAPSNSLASSYFALRAFKLKSNLLGSLGLLAEDGLSLSTESLLFSVVSSFALRGEGVLALLVLGDLVCHVSFALTAMCSFSLRLVHLKRIRKSVSSTYHYFRCY